MDAKVVWVLAASALFSACGQSPEIQLRRLLQTQATGVVRLPSGVLPISTELVIPPTAHDLEIVGSGTVIKAARDFRGRALLVMEGVRNIRLSEFSLDGERSLLETPLEMIPPENACRVWYPSNGILADRVEGLEIAGLKFANIVNFPVLVSRSKKIHIENVLIEDSGSKNAKGRNNLSGGILFEDGSTDFQVIDSTFRRIAGNGLWTHSQRTMPRQEDGLFAANRFDTIGRDALQVGHATRVRVEKNTGARIGYPVEIVDVENGGTPVAIDTAGNVDHTFYSGNSFEEINGKCFDLDGFHDGGVLGNTCINRKPPQDYTFGHFGIVMNNTDPQAHSGNIEISGNTIDGPKYGALFLMGAGNRILNNRFIHVNTARCPDSSAQFVCVYNPEEPKMLTSGIYLGRGVARREETRNNVIRGNEISGHKMQTQCIVTGPGVSASANAIQRNTCEDFFVVE